MNFGIHENLDEKELSMEFTIEIIDLNLLLLREK